MASITDQNWIEVTKKNRKYNIMDYKTTFRLQKDLDIEGLSPFLMSEDVMNMQKNGWRFKCILKGDASQTTLQQDEYNIYTVIPINNSWGDRCVFSKARSL